MVEKLFFTCLKEDRGPYFVEYCPPNPSTRFAVLQVVTPSEATARDVAGWMEAELKHWLDRYPVPVMVSAFDKDGSLFDLSAVRPCDHLIGYLEQRRMQPLLFWELLNDNELPADALQVEYLKSVYASVPYKTADELRVATERDAHKLRQGRVIIVAWLVVVPALIAILGWASPFVSLLALIYSLYQAAVKWLKLTGRWKKSKRELAKEAEERAMRHHHYHCVRNPEGFLRLKQENIKRDERESIQEEANTLKSISRQQT